MKTIATNVAGWTEAEIDRVYHPIPKDDGWRAVTLAYVVGNGRRLWLYCPQCQRERYVSPAEFAAEHGIDLETPLLSIARRMRCTGCRLRLVTVWEEPYSIARSPARSILTSSSSLKSARPRQKAKSLFGSVAIVIAPLIESDDLTARHGGDKFSAPSAAHVGRNVG